MNEFILAEKQDIVSIADSLREKLGISDKISLTDFSTLIYGVGSSEEEQALKRYLVRSIV